MIDTAFVLAAGRGERLRPLTDTIPKPLLPLGNTTLIENNIIRIANAGIRRLVINVWHLADVVMRHVGDGTRYGLEVEYSIEQELLGTGGGLKNAFRLIDRDEFLIHNCDIVTDIDVSRLVSSHLNGSVATLAVRPLREYERYTKILVEGSYVVGIGSGSFNYMGICVATRELAEILPDRFPSCLVQDGFVPAIMSGMRIGAFVYDGMWCDCGTIQDYNAIKNVLLYSK